MPRWLVGVDADQAPRLVECAGHDQGGAAGAAQFQAAVQLRHIAGEAPAADVDGTDVQRAQPGGELFLFPRGRLDHP